MNQDDQSAEAMRQFFVTEAIPSSFQFNPSYNEEDKKVLTNALVENELSKLGGKLIVDNGQPRLVRADNTSFDLTDESGNKVTLQAVVPKAIKRLQASRQAPDTYAGQYQPPTEGLAANQYVRDGIRYTQEGNITYPSAQDIFQKSLHESVNGKMSFHQRAKANIAELTKKNQS